jgi:16S rRNA pseudouridine516 synthase
MKERMRVDQILARYGYCSRSEARYWVRGGRIQVQGAPVKDAAQKAPVADVLIDGQAVDAPNGLLVLLNKPVDTVCSHDPADGPRIYDLLPQRWLRRNPPITSVGRLDKDTTGVLLLTDQGTLVHQWTSPRHKVPKVYEVETNGPLTSDMIAVFAGGTMVLDGETTPCLPAKLEILGPTQARLELVEGRYHQVKRMFAAFGCEVLKLHRSSFGSFTVEGMAPGEWKLLPVPT